MRLYDRIMAHGLKVPGPTGWIDFDPVADQPGFATAVRVQCDDIAKVYWSSDREEWDLTDMGSLRCPFPSLWIEANIPDRILAHPLGEPGGKLVEISRRGHQEGCLVYDQDGAACDVMPVVYDPRSSGPTSPGFTMRVWLTPDGHATDHPEYHGPKNVLERLGTAGCAALRSDSLMLALGLMNCRNVRTEEVPVNPKLSKAQKRRHGVPISRFSRIVLPQPKGGGGHALGGGGAASRHLVRGHFKTYTADAPLMGQHVGTYWWGWHGRGDESLGTVTPTYEVRAPESAESTPTPTEVPA
jgi:hypothetical protein